jgi:hypothetical protein
VRCELPYLDLVLINHCHISISARLQGSPGSWAYGRGGPTGYGLLKVLPGPAMPYPCTPCGRATPETALREFQGRHTCRAGYLKPSSTPLDTPRRTSMTMSSGKPWLDFHTMIRNVSRMGFLIWIVFLGLCQN